MPIAHVLRPGELVVHTVEARKDNGNRVFYHHLSSGEAIKETRLRPLEEIRREFAAEEHTDRDYEKIAKRLQEGGILEKGVQISEWQLSFQTPDEKHWDTVFRNSDEKEITVRIPIGLHDEIMALTRKLTLEEYVKKQQVEQFQRLGKVFDINGKKGEIESETAVKREFPYVQQTREWSCVLATARLAVNALTGERHATDFSLLDHMDEIPISKDVAHLLPMEYQKRAVEPGMDAGGAMHGFDDALPKAVQRLTNNVVSIRNQRYSGPDEAYKLIKRAIEGGNIPVVSNNRENMSKNFRVTTDGGKLHVTVELPTTSGECAVAESHVFENAKEVWEFLKSRNAVHTRAELDGTMRKKVLQSHTDLEDYLKDSWSAWFSDISQTSHSYAVGAVRQRKDGRFVELIDVNHKRWGLDYRYEVPIEFFTGGELRVFEKTR